MANVSVPVRFANDFLGQQANGFEQGAQELKTVLDDALNELHSDPSNPGLLAAYQAAFSSYNVFRNAATNTIKGFKEIDSTIIQAAR
ncbi:type III secretion system needle filament subunit SctF [Pseudomonas typographi]|uniref:Type III secretion system needle filament subunit SctF n=1 Tax=Pseudomonas typographi TaxID=2715964 RepID=A0ABR7Z254_9PSED|nr:type III secretion system needle filament subunit SctF [Pseudomonas typographi]MBD1587204.1 type III secretion system needle filament subunit SctF [Pseudomonas typographi]MBD1599517.1 type III secretion system needle filament subunit SctF [Pseudomonas typographi]